MNEKRLVEWARRVGIDKVLVANDANAAALGEALAGAAKGTEHSVMVTLGTGVGGGVIIDKHIFDRGVNAAVAELGHMVIHVGGRQCSCGRRGCFEAYSSATALTRMTEASVRNGWGLSEIQLEKSSMNDVFAHLSGRKNK